MEPLPAIGFAIREPNRFMLDNPNLTGVEITLERADDPFRVSRYIGDRDYQHVSIHCLKLSPASLEPPRRDYLEIIHALADENGAQSISDHLGFTRDHNGGVELGHFAPPALTTENINIICRNIDHIQSFFKNRTFYLENIAYTFNLGGDISEADFFREVIWRSGCGLLLDAANLYANSCNFNYDPIEYIDKVVEVSTTVQIHLAGGFFDEVYGLHIDSHSEDVPSPVWEIYSEILKRAKGKIKAVYIERDQNFPSKTGWRRELNLASKITRDIYRGICEHETIHFAAGKNGTTGSVIF